MCCSLCLPPSECLLLRYAIRLLTLSLRMRSYSCVIVCFFFFFFSSRRRHTRLVSDWSSDVCSSDLLAVFCATNRDRVTQVFDTLGYFDGVNFAAQATAPALYSVGLMNDVCPPSTVFAAYNQYAGPKQLQIWPYNRHEGGETFQPPIQLRWLRD